MDRGYFYIVLEDNQFVQIGKTNEEGLDDVRHSKLVNEKVIELTEGQYNMLWVYLSYMGGNFDSITDFVQKIRS